jgi:hypothetical protein
VTSRDWSPFLLPQISNRLDLGEKVTDLHRRFYGDGGGLSSERVDLQSDSLEPESVAVQQRLGISPPDQLLDIRNGFGRWNFHVLGQGVECRLHGQYACLTPPPHLRSAVPKDLGQDGLTHSGVFGHSLMAHAELLEISQVLPDAVG